MQHVRFGPPGQLLMSGRTLKALERNTLIPLRDLFGERRVVWSLASKWAMLAGRRVELEGANDEAAQHKVGGMTLAGSLHNELQRQPQSYVKEVLARLSVRGAKLFGTANTEGPYHWLKTDFLDRHEELDLRHWQFFLEDNGSLDPAYVESLKAEYTGMWYKRYILSLWVLAAGLVYAAFDPDRHVRRLSRPFEGHYVAMDYGVASGAMTWSLNAYWHTDRVETDARGRQQTRRMPHVHCLREFYHVGNDDGRLSDSQYIERFQKWMNQHAGRIGRPVVYVDPAAAGFIRALQNAGWSVVAAANDVIEGIRFLDTMITEDRWSCDVSCEHTKKQMSSYIWDEKAQKRGEDKPLKQNDHCPDRERYGAYTRFGSRTDARALNVPI